MHRSEWPQAVSLSANPMPRPFRLLLTCEHAGNHVPARYRGLFRGQGEELAGHRGWDIGALVLARDLQRGLRAPLVYDRTTRLLVDLNRALRSPTLFSEFSEQLDAPERRELLARLHAPHWQRVRQGIERLGGRSQGPVVHLAVHTFTPELDGIVRQTDVGLLYDPGRAAEARFCRGWQRALADIAPEVRVRLNYPYWGAGVGMATQMRRRFPAAGYLGLAVEVNQSFPLAGGRAWRKLRRALLLSLRHCLEMAH